MQAKIWLLIFFFKPPSSSLFHISVHEAILNIIELPGFDTVIQTGTTVCFIVHVL